MWLFTDCIGFCFHASLDAADPVGCLRLDIVEKWRGTCWYDDVPCESFRRRVREPGGARCTAAAPNALAGVRIGNKQKNIGTTDTIKSTVSPSPVTRPALSVP